MKNEWAPTIGFSDFATFYTERYAAGTTQQGQAAWEIAHSVPACLLIYGLATHASLGVESPTFVEIGTQRGVSTSVLLHVAERMNGRVISMDPDPECFNEEAHARLRLKGCDLTRWEWHCAKSQDVAPVRSDFLLVDGDHGYEAVCSDMARHGVAVREGGIAFLDDYHMQFPGKVRWIHERWRELSPLVLGPMVAIVKQPHHDEVYQRAMPDQPNGGWAWALR